MKRLISGFVLSIVLATAAFAQSQPAARPSSSAVHATPSAPDTIYLPRGTEIQIRINESLSSDRSQSGDTFTGSLINSIDDDNGYVLFERGSQVTGRVISAKPSGRLSDSGELVLTINSIRSDRQVANLTVTEKEITGAAHAGSNTAKIGGGAILGAIIGGLAGGGRGAAVGAGAGAAAGTGAAAATGKKEAKVDSESIIHFVTSTETTVVPAGSEAAREIERQPTVYRGSDPNVYGGNGPGPRDANAPVLRRRNGSTVDADNASNPNADPQQNSTIARNTTDATSNSTPRDSDAPVLRRRDNSAVTSDATATQSSTNTTTAPRSSDNTVSSTTVAPDTSVTTAAEWGFSARDRRVISTCLAENPDSVPAKSANAIPYRKGDTLPYAAQRQIRSLPLSCERQLVAVGGDLERIIYNQQVLLINSNNLVLDSFDLNPQQP